MMTTPEKTAVKKLITQKKMLAITAAADTNTDVSKPKSKMPKKMTNAINSLATDAPNTDAPVTDAANTDALYTQQRRTMIANNAYFRAQRRNFSPEGIESDWLDAESEVNSWLS